jgi:mannose-6-phosphate isomerase-like protein (cupin superfamily)
MSNTPTKGFIVDIEKVTEENTDYRRVVFTAKNIQLVLMSLRPGEEIGEETHHLDQFIRVKEGDGTVYLNDEAFPLGDDHAVIVPAGVKHNVVNTGDEELKLYSLYAPPEHKDGTIHPTKADEKEEHFDGTLSPAAR